MVEAAGVEPLGTTFLDEYLPDSSRQTNQVVPADSAQSRAVWQREWQRPSEPAAQSERATLTSAPSSVDHALAKRFAVASSCVTSTREM